MSVKIFHNPRCSKSQQTLALLQENKIEPDVVEYLNSPPSKEELLEVLKLLNIPIRELIRTGEAAYKENNLANKELSDDQLLDIMVANPILIQRPIVIKNGRAVIGRPPENILEII